MRDIASTACATTSLPRSATARVPAAKPFARRAFSAFCFTVAAISSIEAEVSSRLAACSSVRCERSMALVEISAAALATSAVERPIPAMVSSSRAMVRLKSSLMRW